MLEEHDFHVVVAPNGQEALDALRQRKPTLVITDVTMPGIDGYEVARQIRSKLRDRSRLIALSGYGREKDRQQAFQAGFDDHLLKPVDPPRLLAVLRAPRTRR